MLKTSYYNFYIPIEKYNIYLLYNSLYNGLCEITYDKGKYLSENKKITESDFSKIFDSEEKKILASNHLVIDSSIHEGKVLKNRINSAKKIIKNSGIRIAILPTYECNLACPYCFEEFKPKGTMSKEIINKITQLINDIACNENLSKKLLSITWYGGEPLLYPNVISNLSKKLIDVANKHKLKYSAIITTNGVNLTSEIWALLVKCKISQVQVTIDGNRESHNKSRLSRNRKETYNLILENIKKAPKEINKIILRVNGDKDNVKVLEQFLNDLNELKLWPHRESQIKLDFTFKKDFKNNFSDKSKYLSISEVYHAKVMYQKLKISKHNEYYRDNIKTPFVYPKLLTGTCNTTDSIFGMTIDPFGKIYKCWEDAGQGDRQIADILLPYDKLVKRLTNNDTFNFDRYNADKECIECKVFPICGIPCPIRFINQKVNYRKCCIWKNHLEEILSTQYITLKEKPNKIRQLNYAKNSFDYINKNENSNY